MPRFFISETALQGDIITVTGGDAVHIGRSLRMRPGENITFCRRGTEYESVIEKITAEEVVCRVVNAAPSQSEPDMTLNIYQAMPKGDKAELIVQKCTELGAGEITFFISSRCVSRPDKKSGGKKIERLRKIAEEAAKQSGRGNIPQIKGIISFDEAVNELCKKQLPLICYENGGGRLSDISFGGIAECGVMIGSEGGFDRDEYETAVKKGAREIWLGKRILRCETCPIAVTAVIMNLSGNF
ncbi:MAG: 16S rRNA (uracil(1498)-N(3))-methyltransferase [Ruminococcus sp.]|nr:16S rRNA (uracil(1498)-N(3))-methyltransferase [Ruminococcus sp.]